MNKKLAKTAGILLCLLIVLAFTGCNSTEMSVHSQFESVQQQMDAFIEQRRNSRYLYNGRWLSIIFASEDEIEAGMYRVMGLDKHATLVIVNGDSERLSVGTHSDIYFAEYFNYYAADELRELVFAIENAGIIKSINMRRWESDGNEYRTVLFELCTDSAQDSTDAFILFDGKEFHTDLGIISEFPAHTWEDMVQILNTDDSEILREKYLEVFSTVEYELEAFIALWRESEFFYGIDFFSIFYVTDAQIERGLYPQGDHRHPRLVINNNIVMECRRSTPAFVDYHQSSAELRELLYTFGIGGVIEQIDMMTWSGGANNPPAIGIIFSINPIKTKFFYEIRPYALSDFTSAFIYIVSDQEAPDLLNLTSDWRVSMPPYTMY